MPAAAPQATSKRSRYGCHLASCPHFDATVADNCVMPPSRPIEAPVPILISEETARIMPPRKGRRPSPATTTSNTLVVRCLPERRKPQNKTAPEASPPKAGVIKRHGNDI